MNRRRFLATATAATAAVAGCRRNPPRSITGSILGPSHDVGHLLRGGEIPAVSAEERTSIAIVGGGIAGLSAAWWLDRHRVRDFRIFELEDRVGGNSKWGSNAVSAYPWGAHYIPLATQESVWVRALFEEFGVIEGYKAGGAPIYNERYLCAAPEERLYIYGRWQEGLLPTVGASQSDLDEFARFRDLVEKHKQFRDSAGRKAFAIPIEFSSRDPRMMELDRVSMTDYLRQAGFSSERLFWYVDYACRDDYGSHSADVSAWAGIHYFASRDASEDEPVLTWPEGNGWIVRRLEEKLASHFVPSSLVFRIAPSGRNIAVDIYNVAEKRSTRVVADHVIYACPSYTAPFVIAGAESLRETLTRFEYAPWRVANLTLDQMPSTRTGVPLAWDNVIYDSPALGYVVATHQSLATRQRETVLTYYHALAGQSPKEDRQRLLENGWQSSVDAILGDLQIPHPEIRETVRNIDVMKWGHAMIRPRLGFIWGPERRSLSTTPPFSRIHLAHSDLSGISIFEEAQFRGITAAEAVLRSS